MYYLSPYNLFNEYIPTTNKIYMISLIYIVIFIIMIYYLLYLTLTKKSVNSTDIRMELFKKIYINFYEFILFRALILYIFDSYITAIVEYIYKSFEKNGAVYGILEFFLIIMLFYLISDDIDHLSSHAVVANLKAYP